MYLETLLGKALACARASKEAQVPLKIAKASLKASEGFLRLFQRLREAFIRVIYRAS